MESIPEIGPRTARSIAFFFKEKGNRELLARLKRRGVRLQEEEIPEKEKEKRAPFAGKRFIFTGGLEHYSRGEAKDLVESSGARVLNSVSRKVDYVVAGKNPGSKYEKAKELKLRILSEEEFEKLVEE